MRITIPNFKRFNPRSDLKSMPWFRLQNNFYDLEDFYDADANTSWLFIFLLCQCAQKVSDTIEMKEDYLIHKSKLSKKNFHDALKSLLSKRLISLETNESDRVRTDSYLTNEHNEHNEHVHARVFDVSFIYDAYPKKAGKKNGLDRLSKIIKDQDTFDKILQGAQNYSKYVLENNTDKKYIKQFSTWVNQECWEDDYGDSKSILEEKLREIELSFERELKERDELCMQESLS